jgi:WhiB family redox-sensing transcriptional regulator
MAGISAPATTDRPSLFGRMRTPYESSMEASRARTTCGGCAGLPVRTKEALLMEGPVAVADLLGDAPEWQERSLCSQTDPEAFFPEKGGSTREAKRICSRCEVKDECLEYALGHDERFGIWGGLSERERRKLKRRAA